MKGSVFYLFLIPNFSLCFYQLACRSNVEFRAVELCQQIASQKVIELAIKYAARNNRMALANKLESIGEDKGQQELEQQLENDKDCFENQNNEIEEELDFAPIVKKTEIEIRPISLSQGQRRNNPFLKKGNVPKLRGKVPLIFSKIFTLKLVKNWYFYID